MSTEEFTVKTLWVVQEGVPKILVAWDEYCISGYPKGWKKAKREALEEYGDEITKTAEEIEMTMDRQKLEEILVENKEVKTKLSST